MQALIIKKLNKTYKNQKITAVNNVSFSIAEGDFFAMLGPNGAGKTTIISILCSMTKKSSGLVEIFNHNIDTHFSLAKVKIGIVPQEFNFNPFEKVIDIIIQQAGYYGISPKIARKNATKYLKALNLWDKRNNIARHLSGGMKRRLMIVRALIHNPRMLILDEPTAGVDLELRLSLWSFIKELNRNGVTIILTTHYLEEAENLSRNIAILNHGKIISISTKEELLAHLEYETITLELSHAINEHDFRNLDIVNSKFIHSKEIEIKIARQQNINELFITLSKKNIQVIGIRNKTNRLEELFLDLLHKKSK